ncbi:DUF58 domain-containing protein [Rhabdobacter roseus]|uniref:Uncharacterized protein (DUF58 family) n=1 Tax=Rhabdobacter roseus TaxID=1655419 RepID=A0A840U4W3_9BACT|nr:DUF58 domain-containing protein [Rhabdobacter roseus]MBB5286849.1 uncharacterized protein (DUF58 family) [Rhabdobacter roseus]
MNFIRSLYFHRRTWALVAGLALGFVLAFLLPPLLGVMQVLLLVFFLLLLADGLALYRSRQGVFARRTTPERLSNGDENEMQLFIENRYPFRVVLEVIDEIPHQFQRRDVLFKVPLEARSERQIRYTLRPTRRGEYDFGRVNVFCHTALSLVVRRYRFDESRTVAVYPSFLQMRQYALLAVANRLNEAGIRRIRRVGHSLEFDQVRSYVPGDDRRTVNWKASARRGDLMVNAYQDEKAQSVYCLIDKGRTMQSPFEGLTLLDYAINASLVLSNIALLKQDKAGLLTFSDTLGQVVPAERRSGHLQKLLEVLYRQKTRFLETDFERLGVAVRTRIRQRSLLLLFTNFETLHGLMRQLPYLRRLAREHLLVVIFFENTETQSLLEAPARTVEQIYLKTIAERFHYEKKRIVLELQRYGIQVILTPPQQLTANTINKYLELKARGAI